MIEKFLKHGNDKISSDVSYDTSLNYTKNITYQKLGKKNITFFFCY